MINFDNYDFHEYENPMEAAFVNKVQRESKSLYGKKISYKKSLEIIKEYNFLVDNHYPRTFQTVYKAIEIVLINKKSIRFFNYLYYRINKYIKEKIKPIKNDYNFWRNQKRLENAKKKKF